MERRVPLTKVTRLVGEVFDGFLSHVRAVPRITGRPTATVLVGFELEYFDVAKRLLGGRLWAVPAHVLSTKFHLHRDWSYVFEMNGPPMPLRWPLPREYVYFHAVMELVANLLGFRVAHYIYDGDERSCGSHVHFSTVSSTLTAKMHDWLIVLSYHMIPVAALRTMVRESCDWDNCHFYAVLYEPCYRPMVSHYCRVPMMVSKYVVEEGMRGDDDRRWRGYEPEDGNAFYAVELNKYRKQDLTVEFRLNEQHWLSALVIVDIARAVAEKHRVPLIDVRGYYDTYVYTCHPVLPPVRWDRHAYKDHDLFPRLEHPKTFFEFLLEEHERDMLPITREVAERVARKEWLSYKDYLELERRAAEEADCSECLDANELTRKLYEVKVGF